MNFHDHKTFWLFIAVMIGVPSILFVVALLKATTKDPFGRNSAAVHNFGVQATGDMVSPRNGILELQTSGNASKAGQGNRNPHTIQFSAASQRFKLISSTVNSPSDSSSWNDGGICEAKKYSHVPGLIAATSVPSIPAIHSRFRFMLSRICNLCAKPVLLWCVRILDRERNQSYAFSSFSAVPVLDKARGSTADTKANPPRPQGCKGILAAAEPQAARHAQAHADRLSDFQLEGILKRVR